VSAARPEADWRIVCFGGVDWEYNRQRPHWVMSGLAERGVSVLYIDNLGVRLPRPSDARRVARRLSRWLSTSVRPAPEVRPRIRRDAPVVLPVDRPRLLRSLMRRVLVRRIRRRLPRGGRLIVWTYSPLPIIADTAAALGADLLVYDWADDAAEHVLFSSASRRRRIAAWEDAMVRRADVVFMSSNELLKRRGSPNPRTLLVPHGGPPPSEPRRPPPEAEAIPRPRVGFVGTVSGWLDVDLLRALAEARPEWSFVFVGPRRGRLHRLEALPNVTFTGPRRHEAVRGFLAAFDVGLIPYRVVPATQAASPIKLHEYLAHGLPVVSTDLPEVRPFSPPVEIASDPEGFDAAIERALKQGRTPVERRPGVRWDQRVEEMVAMLAASLAAKDEDPSGEPRR
jgi:glycosyltransferase involved in cell wall biosynthesis